MRKYGTNYSISLRVEGIHSDQPSVNIRCGQVVRDLKREAKFRCNFQFR